MVRELDIAIAGAGVGGLACAILLSRLGHRVTVFERFETPRPVGSGLMIQPTGLAALEILGLRAKLEALSAKLTRLHGTTTSGTIIFDVAYTDLAPDLYALGVHRAALHGVLWKAFENSGAQFEGGVEVVSASQLAGGRIGLELKSGGVTPPFDLLIDTSGARSTLHGLVDPHPGKPFEYGAVWASVPATRLNPHALSQRYVRASTMIGHLPMGRLQADGPSLAAFFWSLKTNGLPDWRNNFEAWREHVVELWPDMSQVMCHLTSPDDLLPAGYHHFTAKIPYAGKVVLVGDSAHSTSPQLGQGANNALLDACALAAGLATGDSIEAALKLYAQKRRPHVRFYQLASALMTPIFQGDSHILPWGRDLIFNRLKIVPWLRKEMVRTLAGLKTGPFTCASADDLACAPVLNRDLLYDRINPQALNLEHFREKA
jgi:2-polyprenyl-6-methoxyphenol hydroxylase-like FAD-dependent oxidoreductase